jgi:hypothetical protein
MEKWEGKKKCPPPSCELPSRSRRVKTLDLYAGAPSRLPMNPFEPAAAKPSANWDAHHAGGHIDDRRCLAFLNDPSFSVVDHRRRRSGPDRTETLFTFAHLLICLSANYRRQSYRPEDGPHRRITVLQWEDWLLRVRHGQGRSLRRLPSGSFTQRLSGDGCAKIDEAGNGQRRRRKPARTPQASSPTPLLEYPTFGEGVAHHMAGARTHLVGVFLTWRQQHFWHLRLILLEAP